MGVTLCDPKFFRAETLISRACEALGLGGFKKRRFVSKRITFFSNTRCLSNFRESANSRCLSNFRELANSRCLSNFRELANSRWPQQRVDLDSDHSELATQKSRKFWARKFWKNSRKILATQGSEKVLST